MGKEYKPKYKLTIKYPRLPLKFESGDIVYYNALSKAYVRENFPHYAVDVNEVENNPDFWEEVKQPLFVTEDDIEIFDDATEIISVSIKHHTVSKWGYRYLSKPLDCENFKYFGIEANADKYIEENKPEPLFVTNDNVNIYHPKENVFLVNEFFEKDEGWYNESVGGKVFFHESSADEYIWRNKRVFSYEDMMKAKNSIILTIEDIEKASKERSER